MKKNKIINKLLKQNKKLAKHIENREELIEFLFKRLEDWQKLTEDYRITLNKSNNLTFYILSYTNIIIFVVFIIYLIYQIAK